MRPEEVVRRRRGSVSLVAAACLSLVVMGATTSRAGAQTEPSCSVVYPTANAWVKGTAALLDASPGAGTTRVDFYLTPYAGATTDIGRGYPTIFGWIFSPSSGQTFGWNSTSVADYVYGLQCRAQNSGGTWGAYSSAVGFFVDNSTPTVAIGAPAATAADGLTNGFGGTVTLGALAGDRDAFGLNPNNVTWYVDGTFIGTTGPPTPTIFGNYYTVSWNSHTVADGSHALTARASDAAGNVGTSAPRSILVHNSDLGFAVPVWWIAPDGAAPAGSPWGPSPPSPQSWWMPPWGPSSAISEVGTAQRAGGKWLRLGYGWDRIHPAGPNDGGDWTASDTAVRDAKAAGMKVVYLLYRVPGWANGYKGVNVAPDGAHSTAFQAFAREVATRYGPNAPDTTLRNGVQAYEIWNEPNISEFLVDNSSGLVNSTTYRALLKGGYEGVKAASSSLTVVSGGAAWWSTPSGSCSPTSAMNGCNPVDWYRDIYNAGYNRYFDALGYHPYGVDPNAAGADNGLTETPQVRALMLPADTSKKMWATEVGQKSGSPDPPPPPCAPLPGCGYVDPSVLNQYVDAIIDGWRGFHDADGALYTGPLMYYSLFDGVPTTTPDRPDWVYGLFYNDAPSGAPPAFSAARPKGSAVNDFTSRH